MEIVTGYVGRAHITAEQDSFLTEQFLEMTRSLQIWE